MANSLFDIQPSSCRQPLQPKELNIKGKNGPAIKRALALDPTEVFNRINDSKPEVSPFKRYNTIWMHTVFPSVDGYCSCGCGEKLTGRRARYATESCSTFVWYVYAVIAGRQAAIQRLMYIYHHDACVECGDMSAELEIDHIVPVHRGGGCCWLSNFQFLCKSCHKVKTKLDKRKRKIKLQNQLFLWAV